MNLKTPDLRTRPSRVAQDYMTRKGYKLRPVHSSHVQDQPVWYYYYDLPEGLLELEVELDEGDTGWVKPTAFRIGERSDTVFS